MRPMGNLQREFWRLQGFGGCTANRSCEHAMWARHAAEGMQRLYTAYRSQPASCRGVEHKLRDDAT